MNNLYDVLETCLREIEQGADIDTVLFRYPDLADELRPILEGSMQAKSIAAPEPSSDMVRRNRAKVLQQAAEMRETMERPSRRVWSVPLRRVMVTLFVVVALFVSSTNLVRAASTTVPGDNLYPVKRTWEDVLVLFTFNMQAREALEVAHENERLEELYEVFAEGRSVEVDFAGVVTRQNGDLWLVSKVPVVISAQTDIRAQAVAVGDAVRVRGVTQADGTVLAERVDALAAGVPLPEVDDDDAPEIEQEGFENENESVDDHSGEGSEGEAPDAEETKTESSYERKDVAIQGVVDSVNGSILIINGLTMDIRNAEVKGTLITGSAVKVEGYYDANGNFIVTRIELKDGGSGSGGDDSNDNAGDDNGSGDNGNDDDSNDDNSNDGGDDNSGSGGGDD